MKNHTCQLAWTMVVLALIATRSVAQSIYEPYTFTTLAGNAGYGSADGIRSAARFYGPSGVAVDNFGNVYVADTINNTIRKVTAAGLVTTLAGNRSICCDKSSPAGGYADGTGTNALFDGPVGVTVDSAGNVFVADSGNNVIRKVTPTGVVTTLAGRAGTSGSADGTGAAARFKGPRSLSDLARFRTKSLILDHQNTFTENQNASYRIVERRI